MVDLLKDEHEICLENGYFWDASAVQNLILEFLQMVRDGITEVLVARCQSKDPRGFHRAEHQCTKSQSTQCTEPIPKNRRHVPNLKQWKYFFFSGSVLSATMADNLLERDRKVEK